MNQDEVILGVDTHLDMHVGAVISITGKLLATQAVPTTASGYLQLLTWARTLGNVQLAGVEGTATYGSGLTKVLRNNGISVFECWRRPETEPMGVRQNSWTTLGGRSCIHTKIGFELSSSTSSWASASGRP